MSSYYTITSHLHILSRFLRHILVKISFMLEFNVPLRSLAFPPWLAPYIREKFENKCMHSFYLYFKWRILPRGFMYCTYTTQRPDVLGSPMTKRFPKAREVFWGRSPVEISRAEGSLGIGVGIDDTFWLFIFTLNRAKNDSIQYSIQNHTSKKG